MCTALIAVVASVSGLNVAQQELAVDLGASQSQLLWIINGYTMALAALLLPVGAIGDRWGRKPILVGGLVLFAAANVGRRPCRDGRRCCSPPASLAGVGAGDDHARHAVGDHRRRFPPEQRARAVGIWSGFAGAGGILGLFVSSFLIDVFTWPWLFVMPVLFAAVSLVITLQVGRQLPRGRSTAASTWSARCSRPLAIGGLVLGIHEGPEQGWTDALTLAGLVVGVVAALAFVAWELRHEQPLLEIRLFADRGSGLRLVDVADRVRRDVRDLPRPRPVPPGRARLLGAGGGRRPAADGRRDDAAVRRRPDDRQARRHPLAS